MGKTALATIRSRTKLGIVNFNNAPETTFADIKRVMCGAIKECLAQEEQADGSA